MKAIQVTKQNRSEFEGILKNALEINSEIIGETSKKFVQRMTALKPIDSKLRKYGLTFLNGELEKKGIEEGIWSIMKALDENRVIDGKYCNEKQLDSNDHLGKMPSYAEIHGPKTRMAINSKNWIDNSPHAQYIRRIQKFWNDGYCEGISL